VLTITVEVRDQDGQVIDPAAVGVDSLVTMMRARPPGHPPDPLDGPRVVLESIERVVGQAAALRAAAVAAVTDDVPADFGTRAADDELMAALLVSTRSAQFLRNTAETLRGHPAVWDGLYRGLLDPTRARITASALAQIPEFDPEGQERRQHRVEYVRLMIAAYDYAPDHTPRQLERYLLRLLAQLDPALVKRRRAQAQSDRWVWISHRDDGTSDLAARLRTEEAEAIHAALRAVALRGRMPCGPNGDESSANGASTERLEDVRTFDQRMADALVDLILPVRSGDPGSPTAPANGVQAHVSTQLNVTIPVDSLAGLSDSPGTVSGYGVIPADLARRLAGGDARWRAVLVQRATGAILDVSPWAYRPRAALDRHVRMRDATCRFPGCSVPAAECDLDHLVPFPTGPTTAQNLHALCRHHHRMKHESGWTVHALPDNGLRWTSPSGTVAETWPESYAVAPPDNWVA
jgi:hypothetical protein